MSRSRNKVGHESTCMSASSEEDIDSFDLNDNHMTSSMFLRGNIKLGQENALKLNRNRDLQSSQQQESSASGGTSSAFNIETTGVSQGSTFDINNSRMTSSMFTRGNIRLGKEIDLKFDRKQLLRGPQLDRTKALDPTSLSSSASTEASSTFDVNAIHVTSSILNRVNERVARDRPCLPRPNREAVLKKKCNNSETTNCTLKDSDAQDVQATSSMLERVNKTRGSSRLVTSRRLTGSKEENTNDSEQEQHNLILKDVSTLKTIHGSLGDCNIGPEKQDIISKIIKTLSEIPPDSMSNTDIEPEQPEILNIMATLTAIIPDDLNSSDNVPELQEFISKFLPTPAPAPNSSNTEDCAVAKGTDGATKTTSLELPFGLLPDADDTVQTTNCTYFNYESGTVSSALRKCGVKLPSYPEKNKTKERFRNKSQRAASTPSEPLQGSGLRSEVTSELHGPSVTLSIKHTSSDVIDCIPTKLHTPFQLIQVTSPELEDRIPSENGDRPQVMEYYLHEVSPCNAEQIQSIVSHNSIVVSPYHQKSKSPGGTDNSSLFLSTPKRNKRKSKRLDRKSSADNRRNDHLISEQMLRQTLEELEIRLNGNQFKDLHNFMNFQLTEMLNKLCSINFGCEGVFTYRQLETALKRLQLVDQSLGDCSLLIIIAHLFSPSQYKRAKGILIPYDGKRNTKLNSILQKD